MIFHRLMSILYYGRVQYCCAYLTLESVMIGFQWRVYPLSPRTGNRRVVEVYLYPLPFTFIHIFLHWPAIVEPLKVEPPDDTPF